MFELNQLKQLLTIYEAGTVSKAAEILHISQPALSRSIQRLEEELQVYLFDRKKNKVILNENGKLAVDYARKVLNEVNDMTLRLQAFDRSQRTISLGSCAPAPIWNLAPVLSRLYTDMTIQSEIKSQEQLETGLLNDVYQIIITTTPYNNKDILSQQYLDEHLYVDLPPTHPLSSHKELSLSDLDGQSMLILSKIGFWYDICKEKMPNSLFLEQEEMQVFDEIIKYSALPSFATNLIMNDERNKNRILIPLIDPEVNVTFYCSIKKSNAKRLSKFISEMENLI